MPKVILISGGSDGLGKTIAQKLAPNNQVVILAHNKSKLEAAAKEIGCDFVEVELTDYPSLHSAIDQVVSKYKKIDVLINNAGVWMEGSLVDNDPEKIKNIIDVNTVGTIFLTKAVLPTLISQKSGQIINIISQDGLCAKKDRSVYHASKWAITGFTKCLEEDLAADNIKVTGIYPGLLKTALFSKNGVQRDLSSALDPAEIATLVDFVINLSPNTYLPEIGIKNLLNITTNMDDTNNSTNDLNLDPNMMTTQNSSPQAIVSTPQPPSSPVSPGVIDITPGVVTPTPAAPPAAPDVDLHLADIAPPQPVVAPPITPVQAPLSTAPFTPTTFFTPPSVPAPTPAVPLSPPPMQPTTTSVAANFASPDAPTPVSPIAEDPDLVILQK